MKTYKRKNKQFCNIIIKYLREKGIITKIYNVISVLSTLTIFSGLILFLYGSIVKSNQSDNDLIMKQIKKEIGDDNIISLITADIHGFGNNSIIVTTCNDLGDNESKNNLLILDLVDNEVLRGMNDLFGTKSSYKTTFSYTLSSDGICFCPETEYVLDILGDSTKEIIVKYYVWGSTYGANGTAIFAYSYDDEEYKIIGTYPENMKMDLHMYNNQVESIGIYSKMMETCYDKVIVDDYNAIKCYDGKNNFNLNCGSWYSREYWIDSTNTGRNLVTVNIDKYHETTTYINVYQVIYDKDNNLSWNMFYSEYVENFPRNYTTDDLAKALMDIMDCQVNIVEQYGN